MIKLTDFDPDTVYDADEIAARVDVHRTTVHKQIFPQVKTVRVGRKDRATGAELRNYFSGEHSAA